jgi:3-isopropylmalate/(R)-2-methylmalate dehydratase small subunit
VQKFTSLTAVAAPLALDNVDTDMIIPARHMTGLTRAGLGDHLFEALRFEDDGNERSGSS